MNTTFKDFLHQHAEKHRAESEAAKATIDEWRTAILRLYSQMRVWLKEADADGIIEIGERDLEVAEPGLGRYLVPRLDLRIFGKWIGIIPKARRTVGSAKPGQGADPVQAEGRVDITDDIRRFLLYRIPRGDKDVWMIDGIDQAYEVTDKAWPAQVQYAPLPKPLDKNLFERAIMSYLV